MNHSLQNTLIIIPARFASSRFPGKPLAKIKHKTMIQRVYENCAQTAIPTVVVTDDQRIVAEVQRFGGQVCMVPDEVATGSDRIYLALQRFYAHQGNLSYIINVQGDEPLLGPADIKALIAFHQQSSFDIATMVKRRKDVAGWSDPNRVKAIFSPATGQCLYFSRGAIPVHRGVAFSEWFLHVGVYSYRLPALEAMVQEGQKGYKGYYEEREQLEQLRALELGLRIGAIQTDATLLGVDTPEDLKLIEELMEQ